MRFWPLPQSKSSKSVYLVTHKRDHLLGYPVHLPRNDNEDNKEGEVNDEYTVSDGEEEERKNIVTTAVMKITSS
jgi:hypothetical protein